MYTDQLYARYIEHENEMLFCFAVHSFPLRSGDVLYLGNACAQALQMWYVVAFQQKEVSSSLTDYSTSSCNRRSASQTLETFVLGFGDNITV